MGGSWQSDGRNRRHRTIDGGIFMLVASLFLSAWQYAFFNPVLAAEPSKSESPSKQLWQERIEQYEKQYAREDWPGKERMYRAELEKARAQGLKGLALANLLMKLADCLYHLNNWPAALPIYREALQLREAGVAPDSVEIARALYGVGYCENTLGNREVALPLLKRALAIFEKKFGPSSMENYGPLAALNVLYFSTGDTSLARETSERMQAIIQSQRTVSPEEAYQTKMNVATFRQDAGDIKGARDAYIEARDIRKKMPEGYFAPDNLDEHLRWAEERLFGKPSRTLREVEDGSKPEEKETSLTEPPRGMPPQVVQTSEPPATTTPARPPGPVAEKPGRMPQQKPGETPPADGNYRYYVDGKRVSYHVYLARMRAEEAGAFIKAKQYSDAAAKLKEAVNLDPFFARGMCALGTTLARLGQKQDAITAIKRAISVDPNLDAAWVSIAGLYEEEGLLDDALNAYRQFLRRFPSDSSRNWILSSARLVERERLARLSPSKCPNIEGADGVHDYVSHAARNGLVRWQTADMPVKVSIKSSRKRGIDLAALAKRCLTEWSDATAGGVTFQIVDQSRAAVVKIGWSGTGGGDMAETSEAGEATVHSKEGRIEGADIVIAVDDSDDAAELEAKLHTTVLHEIGHALGLIGHSPDNHDVMYFTELMSGPLPGLSERDRKTIKLLYAYRAKEKTSPATSLGPNFAPAKVPRLNSPFSRLIDGKPNSNFWHPKRSKGSIPGL